MKSFFNTFHLLPGQQTLSGGILMLRKRFAILILVVLPISVAITANVACAKGPNKKYNSKNYEKTVNTWLGHHADELIKSWGIPQGSYPLSDGGHVLEYRKERSLQLPGFSHYRPETTFHSGNLSGFGSGGYRSGSYSGHSSTWVREYEPGLTLSLSCKTIFQVNSAGIIVSWRFEGNDCKSLPPKR